MIKDNHIVKRRKATHFRSGCSEHDRGSTGTHIVYEALCGDYERKRRKPCPVCLRIAAQIAEDAKELKKAGVTFRLQPED